MTEPTVPASDAPIADDAAAREAAALGEDDADETTDAAPQAAAPEAAPAAVPAPEPAPVAAAAPAASKTPAKGAPAKNAPKGKPAASTPPKAKPQPQRAPSAAPAKAAPQAPPAAAPEPTPAPADEPAECPVRFVEVTVRIPVVDGSPEGYCARHIELRMTEGQARLVKRLAFGHECHGNRRSTGAQAVYDLLDQVAAQLEQPAA